MSEKATAIVKTKTEIKKANSGSQSRKTERYGVTNSPTDKILFFQRTIGNQAVQRLFKSGHLKAKLKIGQPNDVYEQEADRVADQVMRMPDNTASHRQHSAPVKLNGAVQKKSG